MPVIFLFAVNSIDHYEDDGCVSASGIGQYTELRFDSIQNIF